MPIVAGDEGVHHDGRRDEHQRRDDVEQPDAAVDRATALPAARARDRRGERAARDDERREDEERAERGHAHTLLSCRRLPWSRFVPRRALGHDAVRARRWKPSGAEPALEHDLGAVLERVGHDAACRSTCTDVLAGLDLEPVVERVRLALDRAVHDEAVELQLLAVPLLRAAPSPRRRACSSGAPSRERSRTRSSDERAQDRRSADTERPSGLLRHRSDYVTEEDSGSTRHVSVELLPASPDSSRHCPVLAAAPPSPRAGRRRWSTSRRFRDEPRGAAPGSRRRRPCRSARRWRRTRRSRPRSARSSRRACARPGRQMPPGRATATPVSTSCARPDSRRSIRRRVLGVGRLAEHVAVDARRPCRRRAPTRAGMARGAGARLLHARAARRRRRRLAATAGARRRRPGSTSNVECRPRSSSSRRRGDADARTSDTRG